jgi:heterodisulfide reductase subunit A
VIATGFQPYEPRVGELGYGELPQVVTLPQLDRLLDPNGPSGGRLSRDGHDVTSVAMIHCVGSRQIEGVHEAQPDGHVNDYCSRVCCTAALSATEHIRARHPDMHIYDVHQDIRTYGRGHEEYYTRAARNGVTFLRVDGAEEPVVRKAESGSDHPVLVTVRDRLTWGEEIDLPVDLVVLAVGMTPNPVDDLIEMFHVSPGTDRFLLEVHPKLQPVETAVNGVVLAGTAQGPMSIQESCAAAEAAAAKVAVLLGEGKVELEPFVAAVDLERCDGAGECARACPQDGAIELVPMTVNGKAIMRAQVTPANCNGCGVCVSVCPNRAVDVQGWRLDAYEVMVEALASRMPAVEVPS